MPGYAARVLTELTGGTAITLFGKSHGGVDASTVIEFFFTRPAMASFQALDVTSVVKPRPVTGVKKA